MRFVRFAALAAAFVLTSSLAAGPVLLGPAPAAFASTPAAEPASVPAQRFNDVPPSQPFYGDIVWLAGQGITRGNSDGGYHPAEAVTRQAMAAFLYRFTHAGTDAPACASAPFTDVPLGTTFCGEIAWLKDAGISRGNPDQSFGLAEPVTRQAMAAFLYRMANGAADAPACASAPFPDVPLGTTFCAEITWLAGQEITDGYPDGSFYPAASISRDAMAAFLHRWAKPGPSVSISHYVRTDDPAKLAAAGRADGLADAAAGGQRLHLLQIGAQTKKDLPSAGVLLSATNTRLTYAQLGSLLRAYTDAYAAAAPGVAVTIAVGANSDGAYDATEMGGDWWTEVVAPLRAATPASMNVVGANDVEPDFTWDLATALAWKTAFLGASPQAELVMNGSADGCPITFANTTAACNHGWTPAQLHELNSGPRVQVLPQVYFAAQGVQWANIAQAGPAPLNFVGSLTQENLCESCGQSADRGWITLWNNLVAVSGGTAPSLPVATNLAIIR